MHELTYVLIRYAKDWEERVEAMLSPFGVENVDEVYEDTCPECNGTKTECPICYGTGTYIVHQNDRATWDWYEIGGIWSEQFPHSPMRHACAVSDLPLSKDKRYPENLLTPQGEWLNRYREKDDEAWELRVEEVYNKYPNHTVVAVDIHY